MGCTSSTPSFVDSSTQHSNATDDMEKVEDNKNEDLQEVGNINNNSKDQINPETRDPVLPDRDIVEESLDIGRHDSVETNADVVVEKQYNILNLTHQKIDEQKVIEIIMEEKKEAEERKQRDIEFLEDLARRSGTEIKNLDITEEREEDWCNNIENNTANNTAFPAIEKKDCDVSDGDDVLSESSRTTRWEALADVAAELPPSLAMDPLTGQIFSLTK